jgi:hypothetical protein
MVFTFFGSCSLRMPEGAYFQRSERLILAGIIQESRGISERIVRGLFRRSGQHYQPPGDANATQICTLFRRYSRRFAQLIALLLMEAATYREDYARRT